jgi:hypothetical protein
MTADLALSIRTFAEPPRAGARPAPQPRDDSALAAQLAPVTPNPRLRLDGSLGMVVIEFRDAAGDVANTIPSPRQIAAYRAVAVTDAPVPVGVRVEGSAAVAQEVAPELPPPASDAVSADA